MEWMNTFRRIGVSNPTRELADVAQEYQRKLDLKRSSISAIMLNSTAKSLVCAELACKTCKQPYNPSLAGRLSGETKKNYNQALQTIEKMIIGHRTGCTVKELTIRLGCSDVASMAETVLDRFHRSLAESVAGASRDSIDVSTPPFIGAAITVVCKLLKFKLDKRKLREEIRCTIPELEKRCDMLTKVAESVVADSRNTQSTKRTHSYAFLDTVDDAANEQPMKRHRPGDELIEDDGFHDCGVPFFSYQPMPDYSPWAASIVQSASQALRA